MKLELGVDPKQVAKGKQRGDAHSSRICKEFETVRRVEASQGVAPRSTSLNHAGDGSGMSTELIIRAHDTGFA